MGWVYLISVFPYSAVGQDGRHEAFQAYTCFEASRIKVVTTKLKPFYEFMQSSYLGFVESLGSVPSM